MSSTLTRRPRVSATGLAPLPTAASVNLPAVITHGLGPITHVADLPGDSFRRVRAISVRALTTQSRLLTNHSGTVGPLFGQTSEQILDDRANKR